MSKTKCKVTGYTKYKTKLEADLAIAHIQYVNKTKKRRRTNREEPKRSYHCNFCEGWHLTSQDPEPGRSRHKGSTQALTPSD